MTWSNKMRRKKGPTPTIGEIFDEIKKAKSKKERIAILREWNGPHIKCLLRVNFDPNFQSALPENPPYTPSPKPVGLSDLQLWTEVKKMRLFTKDAKGNFGHPTLKQIKRESIFIQLLEMLDPNEAELLVACLEKRLKCGLTAKVVNEAYPDMNLPEKVSKPRTKKKDKDADLSEQPAQVETA